MKLFTFSHHGSCLAITCFQRICANVQNRTYSESLHLVNSNTRVKDKIQCRLYVLFQNHHLQNDYVKMIFAVLLRDYNQSGQVEKYT